MPDPDFLPVPPSRPATHSRVMTARPALRSAACALVWLGALGLTLGLAPFVQRAVFVFFWIAVLFAAWYGGFAAGVLAALGSIAAVDYFLLPPVYSLTLFSSAEVLTFAIFLIAAAVVSGLARAAARSEQQARGLAMSLQDQAMELQQQTEEANALANEAQALTEEVEQANCELRASAAGERATTDRARRLLTISVGLSRARNAEEMAEVIFAEGMAATGADAGSLALLRRGSSGAVEIEIVKTRGYSQPVVEAFRRFPLREGRPLSDAILARAPLFLESRDEWERRYPAMAGATRDMRYEAFIAIPVLSGNEVLAGLNLSFGEPRQFDEATRTFLATMGEQCGLAMARAAAADAERRAHEYSASILESIADGCVALDREYRYTYVNARAAEYLGESAESLVGRTIWDAQPTTRASPFGAAFRQVMASRTAQSVEAQSNANGSWVDARVYPSPDGITVFFRDVTQRRRRQEANSFLVTASELLVASLEYECTLRSIAEAAVPNLGDWCAVDIVRDPTAPTWPPVLDRLAAVHRDAEVRAIGLSLADRYPTDWSADGGLAAVLREGRPLFIPHVTDQMLVDGARDAEHLAALRRLQFSSIITVPLSARGLMLGSLTLCMSDSGRHYDEEDLALAQELARRAATAVDNARLYRETERARREAESANLAKSQFLSTMSHELRTPLNAIIGYADLLQGGVRGTITEVQREDVDRIRRSAKVLMSLVNDVLNFARLEAGQVEFQLTDVRLDQVLADIEALVLPQIRAKGLHYEHDSCDDQLHVRADAERLEQILTNLLTNAIKFTDEGGMIALHCDVERDGDQDGGVVRLRVTDSGRGISPDQLERVFEPFVQVDRHLTRASQQGVGLGLAIARDLARQMSGDIEAVSSVGGGSTFTLTLRRVSPRQQR